MTIIYDMYVDGQSFIHRLDPRVKLFGVISGMMITFMFDNLLFATIYYILLVVILLSAKVGIEKYLYIVKLMLPITVLIIVLWPLFYPESLFQGAILALRLNCLAVLAYIFLYTTTQRRMVRGFVKLGLPYRYGTMLSISLRYIPTFGGIISRIMEAQKARGLELEKGHFFQKIKKYIAIISPTIITALRMSDNLAISMESRAFSANVKRTYLTELKAKRKDFITLFFISTIFVSVLLAKFWLQIEM